MARKSSQPQLSVAESQSTDASQLTIDLACIEPYERNPRHVVNPEYDRIKDSIRHHGLDQPLVITQRPGAANYIVQAGGNTRLLILKALFNETGDARFSQVPCLLRHWRRESDVLLAHLRENDLRGSLTFIDKARAIDDAKRLFVEELDVKSVTLRRFSDELRKAGYRISHPIIYIMGYAVGTLLELIPQALEGGLGKLQVKRIRAVELAGQHIWQQHRCTGGARAFDEVFAALCRRYDAPEWDTGVLQGAIENEIAEVSGSNLQTIRAAFDAKLNNRAVVVPEFVALKAPTARGGADSLETGTAGTNERADNDTDEMDFSEAGEAPIVLADDAAQSSDRSDDPQSDGGAPPLIDGNVSKPTDLKSLRGRAWTLAARIAQRNGIGDLVLPLSGKGLGYVLRDVPDPGLADQLNEEALAQINMLWWQLAACAEMTFAPLGSILPTLPDDSVLRHALEDEDAGLLFNSIWTLDPGQTGYRLWRLLHDRDWDDLIHLMDNYRQLRHLATKTGAAIWE